jgi:hypothetical protein
MNICPYMTDWYACRPKYAAAAITIAATTVFSAPVNLALPVRGCANDLPAWTRFTDESLDPLRYDFGTFTFL